MKRSKVAISKTTIIIIILFIMISVLYYASTLTFSTLSTTTEKPETNSNTGPLEPIGLHVISPSSLELLENGVLLDEVPNYTWTFGCGPTAISMVLGYYDNKYDTNYLNGNPNHQYDIEDSIASTYHIEDYAYPNDANTPSILPDKSETGVPHNDNSIADFSETSVSKIGMRYGWSYTYKIVDALVEYSSYKGNPIQAKYYDHFSIDDLKNEIDSGRPFIVFMNIQSTKPNHFATAVGYQNDELIIHTTWGSTIETELLPSDQNLGIGGVILTSDPLTGSSAIETPGFEILTLLASIVIFILYRKGVFRK
jgi:hypothetical protein